MATALQPSQVTANDRLVFSLFLALVFHGIVILGIGFTLPDPKPSSSSLEITLALNKSEKAPDDADFLAQMNQEGSGTLEEKIAPSTTEVADFEDHEIRDIEPLPSLASQPPKRVKRRVLSSNKTSRYKTVKKQSEEPLDDTPVRKTSALASLQRNLEIASLEAELKEQKQLYSKRPRKRQLSATSTKRVSDAAHLYSWHQKVQRIGNLNYPAKARQKHIYGNVRLMVAVNSDGSLYEIRLLKSSGSHILDESAINTVKLAAPFAPFPDDIGKDTDILEIIRTWQYTKNARLSSY